MARRLRRLIYLWLAVVVAATVAPSAFVAAVDPFGYFGTNTAGYYFSSERQFKQTLVRTADYNALVLGDSRIAYTDPSLIRLPQYKWLNGGIGGSTLSEQIDILFNSKLESLDLVVIGLTAGVLGNGQGCFGSPKREVSMWDAIGFAASWTQLWYAVEALRNATAGVEPYYHRDGTRSAADKVINDSFLSDKSARYWGVIHQMAAATNGLPLETNALRLAAPCLTLLERAQSLARERGFRLLLMFLPQNRDFLQLIDWSGIMGDAKTRETLERLRSVIPDVAIFLDSPYSDSANFWLHDSTHFKPDVGARMIEEAVRGLTPPS